MVHDSITHLLLFIVFVILATMLVGVVTGDINSYAQSIDRETDRQVLHIETELTILNDPLAGTTYDDDADTLTVYVKNVGGETLEPTNVVTLVNGQYADDTSTEVIDSDRWRVGTVLEITVHLDEPLDRAEHRLTVDLNGVQETITFDHREAFWLDPDSETEFEGEYYTVDLNESDTFNLSMATEPIQEEESIEYTLDNATVATFNETNATNATGVTDEYGEDETVLDLHEEGSVFVELDVGWDRDTIELRVEDSANEDE